MSTELERHVAGRLASPAAFRAWLLTRDGAERYSACEGTECPLHAWLTDGMPGAFRGVSGYGLSVGNEAVTAWVPASPGRGGTWVPVAPLPDWARNFVRRVDHEAAPSMPGPADALAALDSIVRWEAT